MGAPFGKALLLALRVDALSLSRHTKTGDHARNVGVHTGGEEAIPQRGAAEGKDGQRGGLLLANEAENSGERGRGGEEGSLHVA